MDNNGIKKDCTVAGTHDQYTKPSEIKELQKFLKEVKTAYDENTSLGKDNIGIRGFGDGARMKTVSELSQNVESLNPGSSRNLETYLDRLGDIKKDDKLSKKTVTIEGDSKPDIKSLTSHTEKIISKEISRLESGKETISRVKNIDSLSKDRENINPKNVDKLDNHLENVEGTKDNISELSQKQEKLENPQEDLKKLSKFREILTGKIKNSELESAKELILGKLQTPDNLDNHVEKLDNPKKNIHLETEKLEVSNKTKDLDKLSNTVLPLNNNIPGVKLEDTKERLDGKSEESKLDTTRIDINPKEVKELSGKVEKLNDIPEVKLEDTKEKLSDIKNNTELETTRINLNSVNNTDKLSNTVLPLNDNIPEIKLEDTKERLNGKSEESKLDTTRIDINPKEVKELSGKVEKLNDIPEVKLEDTKEKLDRKPGESKLDTTKVKLNSGKEKISKLPDNIDKIKDIEDPTLSDKLEPIVGKITKDKLEDTKDTLVGEQKEVDLEKNRIDIKDKRKPELDNNKESIVGGISEPSLDDFIDSIIGENSDDTSELETERIGVQGKPEESNLSLENNREEIIDGDNKEGDISELPGKNDSEKLANKPFDVDLENTRLDIKDTRKISLEDEVENITGKVKDNDLEDTRLDLTGIKDVNLENEKIDLVGHERDLSTLEGNIIDEDNKLHDSRNTSLEKGNIKRDNNQGGEADALSYIRKDRLPENRKSDDSGKEFDPLSEKLPDQALERTGNKHNTDDPKLEDKSRLALYKDTKTKNPEISLENRKENRVKSGTKEPENLSSQIDFMGDNKNELKELHDLRKAGKLDEYYSKILLNLESSGNWGKKVQTLMSKYLSSAEISEWNANEYLKSLGNTMLVGKNNHTEVDSLPGKKDWKAVEPMKLPEFSIDSLNINNYLRFVAEKAIGRNWKHGKWLRAALLDTTLAALVTARRKLEKLTKSNRDRLPGGEIGLAKLGGELITGGVKGTLNDLKSSALNALSGGTGKFANPQNRPKKKGHTTGWTGLNNIGSDSTSNSSSSSSGGGFFKKIVKSLSNWAKSLVSPAVEDYGFQHYMKGEGIITTLKDLADTTPSSILTVENLRDALEESEKISTANTVLELPVDSQKGLVGDPTGRTNPTRTLDTNTTWELVLQPYCGALNGYWSYLPSIKEINYWNLTYHHIDTGYNLYIPLTGFEMEKNKINSKSLALFDGEINYPISMEYTNDLRISIADDQYKSWRNYFERCAEVSVYSSQPHNDVYYSLSKITKPTGIDKTHMVIAPYKNITFLCRIYCMTPQYSTINKYTLLLVLKDFSSERTGDVDAGGSDLSVSFSIVGENVPDEISQAELGFNEVLNGGSTGKNFMKGLKKSLTPKIPSLPKIPTGSIKML